MRINFLQNSLPVKWGVIAVAASLLFGLLTSVLPAKISQKPARFGYGSDAEVYWDLAGNLAAGRGFVDSPGFDFAYIYKTKDYTFGTQRLPGYPLALATAKILTRAQNPDSWGIWVFNLLLVFLNAFFVVSLLQAFLPALSEKWYWLVALFPMFLIYSNGINSDFFTAVLLAGFCYFFTRPTFTAASAPLAAWAVFSRANALFFVGAFLLLYFIFNFKTKRKWLAVGCLAAVVAVFCLWSLRNDKLSGHFVYDPFSGQQLQQNYINKIYKYTKPQQDQQYWRWTDGLYTLNYFKQQAAASNIYAAEVALNQQLTRDTVSVLLRNKLTAVKIYSRDVAQVLTNEYFVFNMARQYHTSWAWAVAWVAAVALFTLPGLTLLLLALYFVIKKRKHTFALTVYSAAAYILLTASVLGDFARYMVPVGFAIIFAVAYVGQALKKRI